MCNRKGNRQHLFSNRVERGAMEIKILDVLFLCIFKMNRCISKMNRLNKKFFILENSKEKKLGEGRAEDVV